MSKLSPISSYQSQTAEIFLEIAAVELVRGVEYLNSMSLLRVLFWLSSTTGTLPDHPEIVQPPSRLEANFAFALSQINFAEGCAELHPRLGLETEIQRRHTAYLNAERDVQSVWGSVTRHIIPLITEGKMACSKRSVSAALQAADTALAEQNQAYSQAIAVMAQGAWLGPIKLCRGAVKRVEVGRNEMSGQATLDIELSNDASTALAEFTSRSIGGELAIRMNGHIILQPIVNEPIINGSISSSGLDDGTLGPFKEMVAGAC